MTEPTSGWTAGSGARIHYLDSGPDRGNAPPLLFVPGFGEEAADHLDLIRMLAPRRVVIPDLRGRGPSEAPASDYSLAAHVADIGAVVEHAGLQRFHLASYSRGTAYALGWAVDNPSRLRSITVAEYPAAQLIPPPGAAATLTERQRFGRPLTDRVPTDVIHRIFGQATHREFYDAIAALPIPLQVIRGTRGSTLISEATMADYRSARPDLVLETFEDSGHDLWRPDPARLANTLGGFLASVDAVT